jgi:hypothetical protein
MKQYNLGPNGGIMTSLNLFATRFDQACRARDARPGLASRKRYDVRFLAETLGCVATERACMAAWHARVQS